MCPKRPTLSQTGAQSCQNLAKRVPKGANGLPKYKNKSMSKPVWITNQSKSSKFNPGSNKKTISKKHENNAKQVPKWSRNRCPKSSSSEQNHENHENHVFLIWKTMQTHCKTLCFLKVCRLRARMEKGFEHFQK